MDRNEKERSALQDEFLDDLRKGQLLVSVFLVNGIKLQGYIQSFDQYVIFLKNTMTVTQMIYKHAVSTVSHCVCSTSTSGIKEALLEKNDS